MNEKVIGDMGDLPTDLSNVDCANYYAQNKRFGNEESKAKSVDKKYLVKKETIIVKQNLTSFSHLLDFTDIEEQAGRISLPRLTEIFSEEFAKRGKKLSSTENINMSNQNVQDISLSLYDRLKRNISSLFSFNEIRHRGLLLVPNNTALSPASMINKFKPYNNQQLSSSVTENLKSTIMYYILQEGVANPVSEIRHSTLVQSTQLLIAALYFRNNISEIMKTIAHHEQFIPVAETLMQLKQQIVTHLACGTAFVALGDIFIDGNVTDLWVSLGCLGLFIMKSKNKTDITTKVVVNNTNVINKY